MKTIKIRNHAKNTLSGILMIMMVFMFNSCAVKSKFMASSVVPNAQGKIKVNRDKNKNYVIQIKLTNLAEVEKLQTSKNTYVVWMQTDEGNTENLGQLNSSKGLFTKKREASLDAVSSYKPAKIFITAEDNSNVQIPDEKIILSTGNF